jgi:hypothetical protein
LDFDPSRRHSAALQKAGNVVPIQINGSGSFALRPRRKESSVLSIVARIKHFDGSLQVGRLVPKSTVQVTRGDPALLIPNLYFLRSARAAACSLGRAAPLQARENQFKWTP